MNTVRYPCAESTSPRHASPGSGTSTFGSREFRCCEGFAVEMVEELGTETTPLDIQRSGKQQVGERRDAVHHEARQPMPRAEAPQPHHEGGNRQARKQPIRVGEIEGDRNRDGCDVQRAVRGAGENSRRPHCFSCPSFAFPASNCGTERPRPACGLAWNGRRGRACPVPPAVGARMTRASTRVERATTRVERATTRVAPTQPTRSVKLTP